MTPEQENELRRLASYFPYRICYMAIRPLDGMQVNGADTTKHKMNSLIRAGWTVYCIGGRGK